MDCFAVSEISVKLGGPPPHAARVQAARTPSPVADSQRFDLVIV